MSHLNKKVYLAIILYIFWVSYYTVNNYIDTKNIMYQEIDKRLMQGAETLPLIIPNEFHKQDMDKDTVSKKEDWKNITQLSKLADTIELKYVYSLILKDGKVRFSASSGTSEERKTKHNLSTYFSHYDDIPVEIKVAFDTGKIQFAEYSDKWGEFRSVFIPILTQDNSLYISAADIEISHIKLLLKNSLFKSLIDSLWFILFIIPFIIFYFRDIKLSKNRLELNVKERTKELSEKTEELKKQKDRYQNAINGSQDGIWDWDLTDNSVYFSPRWKKMLGYNEDELPNEFNVWESRAHPDDLENVFAGVQKHINGETDFYEGIHRLKHKNGHWVWILNRAKTIFDENGKVTRISGTHTDVSKEKELEIKLKDQKNILHHQAHHDALTKLPNRVLFNDRLEQAIEKAKRNNSKFALLFIDLDHFKEINDSLGHDIGDDILKIVTSRFKETTRDENIVARLGGDEFTIIVEDLVQIQDASLIASKLLEVLSKAMNVNDNTLYVSSSIGISIYPDDGVSTQNLLKFADSAMYKAKDEGRNNYQYYNSTMTELAFERVVMETSLRRAIEEEQFVVYYQPQVDGETDKLIGMEALVRWQHPTMGLVSPDKFIPLAESTGLIVALDRLVMKTAMTQIAKWYKDGFNPGILSMNLAVKQLQKKDFIEIFENIIKETGCKVEWLELEVTEGQIMTNPEEAIKILTQISDLGIELAIDDFGTGYSSLAYLKRLPINKLKIDREFVRDLPDDEEDAGITKAVIALAKSLNLKVIAEGVETKEQKDFLVENGCKKIQGYFYSKPVPANDLEGLLKDTAVNKLPKPFQSKT